MNDRILITDRSHPVLKEILLSNGFLVDDRPNISYEEFEKVLTDYEGVIINSKTPMPAGNIQRAERLKFIARLGSGLDIIDLEIAEECNVAVFSAPEGNANAVAEHALGMLLALMNNLTQANSQVRAFQWERELNRGIELEGKTVGVIGYGNNGSAFVRKLAGLNVKVLAFDKYRKRYADDHRYLTESDLQAVLEESDILSLHIPLTDETKYWVDKKFMEQMKPGAILINTSRGKIIRTIDLVRAMESGHVGGACLDVFENEDPDTYTSEEKKIYQKLFSLPNVILSPHVAGWTKESLEKIARVLASKILDHYKMNDAYKI